MDTARFQAQEILDGLVVAHRAMDAGRDEDRAIAAGVRLVRGRFLPEMKDEAEQRLRTAWAILKG